MRFRFRGSYSHGEQFECKDPVSASQGRALKHVVPSLNSKFWGEPAAGKLGPHPKRELCAQFPGVSHAVTGGGLVFLLPNRGARAAKLTTEVLQNLFYGLIKTDVGFPYAASHRLLTVATH
jgi:hypothetical protein